MARRFASRAPAGAGPRWIGLALAFVSTVTAGCSTEAGRAGCADLVLRGGPVFVSDTSHRVVEAIAVEGEVIAWSGAESAASEWICPDTKVIELDGRLVTPGMNDAHLHLGPGGLTLLQVRLLGTVSAAEVEARVREAARVAAPGEWILGRGWDHTRFPPGDLGPDGWPTRDALDRAAPDNPVVLRRVDGHAAWMNAAAIQAAGLGPATADPPGGRFRRDPVTGELTGILHEDPALALVMSHAPPISIARRREGIRRAMDLARRTGVTSVQSQALGPELEIYKEMERSGELTLRIYAWRALNRDTLEAFRLAGITQAFGGPWLRVGAMKIYADGTLGSRTASMLEPFTDDPTNHGIEVTAADSLRSLILAADSAHVQVLVHAIGDSANRLALDILEEAARSGDEHARRHRIEHAQILDRSDIPRFARLGVIASVQPTHATSDMRWVEDRIGPERAAEGAYAWRSLAETGAAIAFGTDWVVEPLAPVQGLYSAVTRQSREEPGQPAGGWLPEQRLGIEEAIRFYTAGSAYAEFEEHRKGTLEPGMLADIVVWDRDLLSIPAVEILQARPDFTIVGGRIVYERTSEEGVE
jgi:predicted amidohydrolase YtcJ